MKAIYPLLLALSACGGPIMHIPGSLDSLGRPAEEYTPSDTLRNKTKKSAAKGKDVVRAARHYLSHRPKRDDCSGFVEAVFDRLGLDFNGSVSMMWDQAKSSGAVHHRKRPRIGDLIFFDNTHDNNGNQRWDDPLTHIAVVIDVEPDGTIVFAHGGTGRGRTTGRMNLQHPSTHSHDEFILNDYLRRSSPRDPPRTTYLAGELWRGFATLYH
ncbi:MAG: CHAP domain-containing protein [Proteobacteria bacterium]|nr:CHAP domain-containing protein [Pseudomonadota bacterium]